MPKTIPHETNKTGPSEGDVLTNPNHPIQEGEGANFPVVGVGASAGGLEAFEHFFTNLPPDAGMAFVLVQHLSQSHESILPEIIQRFTRMPVTQVTDRMPVKPNCVYVIPPGTDLALTDGHLTLMQPEAAHGFRLPIDFFFRSLARDQHERAIGIVLSGTGSDGSQGVKSIKAEGGLTIAQAPETAAYADMPRNAIATQDVDFILPPAKMGEMILKVIHHQVLAGDGEGQGELPIAPRSLQKLYSMLHTKTGYDFSLYKHNTVLRRIERRMKINLVPDHESYTRFMEEHPQEVDALFHEMLIHVTNFFRDPEAFQALVEKAILPLLYTRTATNRPLRVWVAGCSTGEEAYSVAIAIQEQIERLKMDCTVQIYATDIDLEAIQTARAGLYPESIREDISEERLLRYFNQEDRGYQIKKIIRDRVIFATQNLISDPPFSKIDLLCCRNLLIYLEPELQNRLISMFHQALNPEGVLFLGNSESISGHSQLFGSLDRKHKLFRRKEIATLPKILAEIRGLPRNLISPAAAGERSALSQADRLRVWTEQALLEFHTPACVILDERHNILFIHGHTGKFLEPAPGAMHAEILGMAREGLKTELATALHAATMNKQTVHRRGVRVKTNGEYQAVTLTVMPITEPAEFKGYFMVVLEEEPAAPVSPDHPVPGKNSSDRRAKELQKQLKEKDDYLRVIIAELENTNQDLKSANEELQSTNEEMQSSNEELETSKEELQSSNEELSIMNSELQKKNEELSGTNNDMFNLLASTEIGTLFLDLDLRLRRFTPAVNRLYNFIPTDIGRPVAIFVSRLEYASLVSDSRQVLASLVPKSIEVQAKDGAWYLVSIKPYRTLENVVDGVVITFVDISEQKQSSELRRMGTILRDSNDALTVQDFNGKILAWNRGAAQMYGWNEAEALKMNTLDLIPEGKREETAAVFEKLARGEPVRSYETQRITRDGRTLDVWMTLTSLVDDAQQPVGIATTERDITERTRAMQRLLFGNRAVRVLNRWYKRLTVPDNPPPQAADACRILVEEGGYRMAWVGRQEKPNGKLISPVGWAGLDGEPEAADRLQPLVKAFQEPLDKALSSGKPVVVRRILTSKPGAKWHEAAVQHKFGAFAVLPLTTDEKSRGVLLVCAAEPEAFEEHELDLLVTLSESLARLPKVQR